MKKKINYLFLFASIGMLSQSNTNMELAGAYKLPNANPEGGQTVIINKEGTFATFFFGGALKGTWIQVGNKVQFEVNKKPDFVLYGRNITSLKDSTRLEFTGFSQNPTFVNLNTTAQKGFQRVFNENANCFDYPYIHQTENKLAEIAFAKYSNREKIFDFYTFDVPAIYNDFVVINLSSTYTQDYKFSAEIKEGQLYFDGSSKPAKKTPIPTTGEDAVYLKAFMVNSFFPEILTEEEEFFPIYDQPTKENVLPFSKINTFEINKAMIDVLSRHLFTANCD